MASMQQTMNPAQFAAGMLKVMTNTALNPGSNPMAPLQYAALAPVMPVINQGLSSANVSGVGFGATPNSMVSQALSGLSLANDFGKLAKAIYSPNSNLLQLNKMMQNINSQNPGAVDLIANTANTFNSAIKQFAQSPMVQNNPQAQKIFGQLEKVSDAFANFANDYQNYTNSGGMLNAGRAASSWCNFKQTYNKSLGNVFGQNSFLAKSATIP